MVAAYTQHDKDLAGACVLILQTLNADGKSVKASPVIFQFPPRILSDNRKGSWEEGEEQGTEPISNFKTSGPREMSLSWTYIVDGGKFTTDVIAKQIKKVRGYFFSARAKKHERNLVVAFQYILYGGTSPMSFRIKSVDVKHSDTIICPGGNTANAFPLRTDITLELRLWTQGGSTEKIQALPGLKIKNTPDWY